MHIDPKKRIEKQRLYYTKKKTNKKNKITKNPIPDKGERQDVVFGSLRMEQLSTYTYLLFYDKVIVFYKKIYSPSNRTPS